MQEDTWCDQTARAQGLGLRALQTFALSPRVPSALLVALLSGLGDRRAAQAVGGADKARPVAGDPGISSMVVMDQPEFRVLRDYAEPGATRRMHSHDDATWHVFTLVTGQLLLTIEGESPVEVTQGQVLNLKGGAKHTFKNTGGRHRDHRRSIRQGAEALKRRAPCSPGTAEVNDEARNCPARLFVGAFSGVWLRTGATRTGHQHATGPGRRHDRRHRQDR